MHVKERQSKRGMSSMERCPPLTVRCLLQVGLLLRWPFGEQKPCLPGEESSVPPGFVWDGCHHQQTQISAEKLGGMCRGRLGSAEMWLSPVQTLGPYRGDQETPRRS